MFANKLDTDVRTSVVSFTIPIGGDDIHLGLVLSSLDFWNQLTLVMIMQAAIGSLIALFVQSFIIKKRDSLTSYLVGYGIVIPFAICLPFYLIEILEIKNTVLMATTGGAFALQALRCVAAMHGTTTPTAVEMNRFHYCIYFCSIVDLEYNKQGRFVYVRNRSQVAIEKLKTLAKSVVLLGSMYSILEPIGYKPFEEENLYYSTLHWKHVLNNFSLAYLWHLCLLSGSSAFGMILACVTGIKTKDMTNNPMFGSFSPSDFWGRRWNNVVHKVLKDSVYRPLIRTHKAIVTSLAVFFTSGLLHEYVLLVMDLGVAKNTNLLKVKYGIQTRFFLWNAVVLICEYCFADFLYKIRPFWMKNLPRVIISITILMTVLPISHWFSDAYITVGILSDYKLGFPMIVAL